MTKFIVEIEDSNKINHFHALMKQNGFKILNQEIFIRNTIIENLEKIKLRDKKLLEVLAR